MASVSYQVVRDGLNLGGPSEVAVGTAAPTTANNIELRVDLAAGWTKEEVIYATKRIFKHFLDAVNGDNSIPL